MQNTYKWTVTPSNQPTVIRNCPKCGNNCEYESSGNFRVNANQSLIDVWLIYQCRKCKSTWNMEILSRTNAKAIDKELYLKFLSNDRELARQYAFDVSAHSKNKSVLSYENINYEVIGESFSLPCLKEKLQIELICEYPLDLRLDKILSKQLGVSRDHIKRMSRDGIISGAGVKDISNIKIKNGITLLINHTDSIETI